MSARAERRRLEREERKKGNGRRSVPDQVLRGVIGVANIVGPVAARHGCVVVIQFPDRAGETADVAAYDAETGERKCWGCGTPLDDAVVGTTHLGRAGQAVQLLLHTCDDCVEPWKRSASA